MRNRCRDYKQQPRGGRQRSGNAARRHECDDPVRQSGDFRIRQHHDVTIDIQLVALPTIGLGSARKTFVRVVVVLHTPVAIFVLDCDKAGPLPAPYPVGTLFDGEVAVRRADCARLDGVDQVVPCHRADRWGRRIQQGDKQQCKAGGRTSITHARHREKTHDHVRQARRTDHQRQRDTEDVDCALCSARVLRKAKGDDNIVELFQQSGAAADDVTAESDLRKRIAGQLDSDKHGRYRVGENEHAVLCHLGVCDALHPAKNGVHEYDTHANHETERHVDLKKP